MNNRKPLKSKFRKLSKARFETRETMHGPRYLYKMVTQNGCARNRRYLICLRHSRAVKIERPIFCACVRNMF